MATNDVFPPSDAAVLAERIVRVQARIAAACAAAGRAPDGVTLLAVSKTFPAEVVRAAHAAGLRAFGENYVQEAVAKIDALHGLRPVPEWHFIGPLQSNKTRLVAERFDWVHSLDRVKLAERLSAQRPPGRAPLQVCLQVNISGEATKSGFAPAAVLEAVNLVTRLPNLTLRGLMAIPAPAGDEGAQRAPHRALRELLGALNDRGFTLDTLSMGMSDDLEAAIAEGATCVRVGSALFGARPPAHDAA